MPAPALDLNLLPILLALHEERSVSRAAARLGMTQPALSGALAKLRRMLGDPLFIRADGAMAPTPRALALVDPVQAVLGTVRDRILAPQAFAPERLEDTITVALSDVGEMVFLPRLLDALRKQAPRAALRSVNLPHDALDGALGAGEVDLAVGYFPDLGGSNIFQQRLMLHRFVCLVRSGHPVADTAPGSRIPPERFLQLEHAVVRAPGRSMELFEAFLRARRIERRVALVTPHFLSIPTIIARSDLLVTVPHAIGIAYGRAEFGLKALEPPFDLPPIELKQHWHRRMHEAPRNAWLRGLVARLFSQDKDEWAT